VAEFEYVDLGNVVVKVIEAYGALCKIPEGGRKSRSACRYVSPSGGRLRKGRRQQR